MLGRGRLVVMPGHRSRTRLLHRACRLSPKQAAQHPWLIISPHPDDETLGAGGLISTILSAGGSVSVAYLTDGAASHVGAPGWRPRRIAALRAREAATALRTLGSVRTPLHLGWRDAAPAAPGSATFMKTVARLVSLCRRRDIRHIVTSWVGDPHCDHEAAAAIGAAVAKRLRLKPSHYCVWGWTLPNIDRSMPGMRAIALPIASVRGQVRRALNCHRSQLGGRIFGAREQFILPRPMRRLVDTRHMILLEERHAA